MTDDNKANLPSDREDAGLKPRKPPEDREPSTPPPDEKKVETDPSEQPS